MDSSQRHPENDYSFAVLVRTIREDAGLTQQQLADDLYCSRSLIGNVETSTPPSEEFVKRLCELYPDRESALTETYAQLDDRRTPHSTRRGKSSFQRQIDFKLTREDYKPARTLLLDRLRKSSDPAERVWCFDRLAVAYFYANRVDDGLRALRDGINEAGSTDSPRMRGQMIDLVARLATRLRDADQFEEAKEVLDNALLVHVGARELWRNKGTVHWYAAEFPEAYAALMAAVKHGMHIRRVLSARGQVLAEWGNCSNAVEDLNRVITDSSYGPLSSAHARSARAYCLARGGDIETALREWQIAEEITPENAWLHYFRSISYFDAGEKRLAREGLQRALDCDGPQLNLPKRLRAEELLNDCES